jgi:hypothetical protein
LSSSTDYFVSTIQLIASILYISILTRLLPPSFIFIIVNNGFPAHPPGCSSQDCKRAEQMLNNSAFSAPNPTQKAFLMNEPNVHRTEERYFLEQAEQNAE